MSGRIYLYGGAALALLSLALAYGTVAAVWGVGLAGGVALLWAAGLSQEWTWISPVSFLLVTALAAVSLLTGAGTIWAIVAVVAALAAWEVDSFRRFLANVPHIRDEAELLREHDRRLFYVAGLGVGLAVLATVIEIDLGFGLAFLLSIISLAGISRAVQFLRN